MSSTRQGPSIQQQFYSVTPWLMISAMLLMSLSTASGQQKPPPPPPPPPQQPPKQPPQAIPQFGDPVTGLTGQQLAAFNAGKAEFTDRELPADGLGPIFNRDSCVACHSGPAVGGSSNITATRFGRVSGSTFDPLTSLGGSLLQEKAISPEGLEKIPAQANITALRQTTALFGMGLIEAIPDATILKGVRAKAVDGVLGKAAMVQDVASGKTMVGRFGWKAQQATLLAFAGDAYVNEMGITNRLFPTENAPNGNLDLLKKLDKVKDPEDPVNPATGKAGIDALADYMRMLAPPPTQSTTASTVFGAKFFLDCGCTSCHTPSMTTGNSPLTALNNVTVSLYSDLLLHDMGNLGDGIVQGAANAHEMKTPPLWGVRASAPYLHDGRAKTLDNAIQAHDGEAKTSRDKYLKLSADQQSLLVEFLNSL
ncbi:MAG: hypothetical protein JWP89_3956 [Schlesneria sp.]|nr:hypothetical protein [Schlesneria sp.]